MLSQVNIHMWKINLDTVSHHTEKKSTLADTNNQMEKIKQQSFWKESIGEAFQDLTWDRQRFLKGYSKVLTIKEKVGKLDYIKIKNSFKDNITKTQK